MAGLPRNLAAVSLTPADFEVTSRIRWPGTKISNSGVIPATGVGFPSYSNSTGIAAIRCSCLGEGLGTDWVQFALDGRRCALLFAGAGTAVPGAAALQLRGLTGQFPARALSRLCRSPATRKTSSACPPWRSPIQPIGAIVGEIFRVLKPGRQTAGRPAGEIRLAVSGSRSGFPGGGFSRTSRKTDALYSCRSVKLLFGAFSEPRILKRHLRRSDIPHIWRWMLLPVLERIMGRYLVLKTFKPVGAGLALRLAA